MKKSRRFFNDGILMKFASQQMKYTMCIKYLPPANMWVAAKAAIDIIYNKFGALATLNIFDRKYFILLAILHPPKGGFHLTSGSDFIIY